MKKDNNNKNNISRRDFVKTGLLAMSAGAIALSGCNKENNVSEDTLKPIDIIPKQTATYEFSAPLPFDYKTIDEMVKINSKLKKSKITSLYNNIPHPLNESVNQWVEILRGDNNDIKSYKDFEKFIKYAQKNNFNFTYLMNSPKPFSQKDFLTFKDNFKRKIDFLKRVECKDIKVGNTQVCILIQELAPNEFNLHASTVFEFQNISQYINLFDAYKNFSLIDVPYEQNQNFSFLKSLKKTFPKIKTEIMVNETCLKGCPARFSHQSEFHFCVFNCGKNRISMGNFSSLFKTSTIYPWDIEYYSAIGINNFKYTAPGDKQSRANFRDVKNLAKYLDCIEHGTDHISAADFFKEIIHVDLFIDKDVKMSQIKQYFPNIEHFIKYGDKCATRCTVDCNYCTQCGKNLEKFLLYS